MNDELRWVMSGNVLTIIKYPPQYLEEIVKLLSFYKKEYDRKMQKTRFIFCPCVVYEDVNRNLTVPKPREFLKVLPKALTTFAGYRYQLDEWAKKRGVRVEGEDLTPPVTQESPYYPRWDLIPKDFEFRFMQREVLRCFSIEHGGIILCTPGFGKTELLGLACQLFPRARILITTYNQSVYRTIGACVLKYIPPSQAYIQRATVPVRLPTVEVSRVVVCGTGTLAKVLSAGTDYDFCFIDEAHLACTDKTFEILAKLSQPRIFGMTGSLKRFDGSEFRMKGLAGPVRINVDIAAGIKNGLVTPVEVRWVPVRMKYDILANIDKPYWKHVGIWNNTYRNKLIAKAAGLYGPDEQVLILCETEKHLKALGTVLPEGWTFLHAEIPLRAAYEDQFRNGALKKVVSTMMWRQGIDFPNLSVLIRADGLSSDISSIQIGGRVIRRAKDKPLAYIYDFNDVWHESFERAATERRRIYESCTWEQVTISPQALLEGKLEVEKR